MSEREAPVERVQVWQCIGCGKIEASQPCIGVCRDRKAELVYAGDYDLLAAEAEALCEVVRRIVSITPREAEFESCYVALQQRARELISRIRKGRA